MNEKKMIIINQYTKDGKQKKVGLGRKRNTWINF